MRTIAVKVLPWLMWLALLGGMVSIAVVGHAPIQETSNPRSLDQPGLHAGAAQECHGRSLTTATCP